MESNQLYYVILLVVGTHVVDPLKRQCEEENIRKLRDLRGKLSVFKAEDSSKFPNSPFLKQLEQNCPAPSVLELKENAQVCLGEWLVIEQVILLRNLSFEKELVNGARGIVIGFEEGGKYNGCPIVRFTSGHE